MGGRGPKRRGNGSGVAARSPRGRSDENGYEGRKREGHGISHARVALLQVRILMAVTGRGQLQDLRAREATARGRLRSLFVRRRVPRLTLDADGQHRSSE